MRPIPKPEARKRTRARTARQHAAQRKAAVDAVWKRAESCCEACGRWVKRPRETDSPFDVGHVHEIVPRSLGGDDTDQDAVQLLCVECHARAHGWL